MKSKILALGFVVALLFCMVTMGAKGTAQATAKGGYEVSQFQNLKVLPQGISEDSLDMLMGMYKTALGVKCGFCHARSADTSNHHLDFASDAKPEKEAARAMMKMTAGINSTYFNWMNSPRPDTIRAVTCYTCHKGSPEPSRFPGQDNPHTEGNGEHH